MLQYPGVKMENITITATTKTDSGLDYNNANVQYSPGQTFEVKETMGLYFDNEVFDQYIEYIEILSVDIEYVVNESEWYVSYKVGHYAYDQLITTITLDNEDLEEF